MNTESLIKELKTSGLYAECPKCGGEFELAKAIIFDASKPFPKEAIERQRLMIEAFDKEMKELEKRKKRAKTGAKITAEAVNIGKKIEVLLPTLKEFKWNLPDCRFLGEPLDFIAFNGLSRSKVDSVSFIEVKSGGARLNGHQKAIKDAIEDKKVSCKVIK